MKEAFLGLGGPLCVLMVPRNHRGSVWPSQAPWSSLERSSAGHMCAQEKERQKEGTGISTR